jgi:hypothetical protein
VNELYIKGTNERFLVVLRSGRLTWTRTDGPKTDIQSTVDELESIALVLVENP